MPGMPGMAGGAPNAGPRKRQRPEKKRKGFGQL